MGEEGKGNTHHLDVWLLWCSVIPRANAVRSGCDTRCRKASAIGNTGVGQSDVRGIIGCWPPPGRGHDSDKLCIEFGIARHIAEVAKGKMKGGWRV